MDRHLAGPLPGLAAPVRKISAPPSVLAMIEPAPEPTMPTAMQSKVDGHETPSREATVAGTDPTLQVTPPSEVARATPAPELAWPTATQFDADAHETEGRTAVVPGTA